MAWRFKVSKYKNAVPLQPKREDYISDIKVGAPQSCGNHIKASAAFIAFNVENRGGGSLGIVPLNYKGRLDPSAPLIHGHSDLITDFNFSPFDDGMLATCSTDAEVRIWHIPEGGLITDLSDSQYTLPQFDKRVENVLFHPTADCLIAVSYFDTVKLWDIQQEKEVYGFNGHDDQVQCTCFNECGSLFATAAKDKLIRIIDPRIDRVVYEAEGHKSPKDSRILWLGSTDRVITTGFDSSRMREIKMRDIRNFIRPYKTQSFDSSTGVLIPLYDADTSMLFLAGKADVGIMYWEVQDKDPYLIEGLKYSATAQTKGATLVPKRGLDVMNGEVNRVLQLVQNAIVPITYQVPRKTYREFHCDLFPDTYSFNPSVTVEQWLEGANVPLDKISLDPAKRNDSKFQIHRGPLSKRKEIRNGNYELPVPAPRSRKFFSNEKASCETKSKPTVAVKPNVMSVNSSPAPKPALRSTIPTQDNKNYANEIDSCLCDISVRNNLAELRRTFEPSLSDEVITKISDSASLAIDNKKPFVQKSFSVDEKSQSANSRRTVSTRSFRRISKFRHLKGSAGHKSTHIENLRDLNKTIPFECDGMAVNAEFVVLPLTGLGGKLSILKHTHCGKIPDGVIPSLVNGTAVLDFAFDPFNDCCLAVACDDGRINLWYISEDGLQSSTNESSETFTDSTDKLTILKWHPLAAGILAAVCGDFTVRIWDLYSQYVHIVLQGHEDQIFSFAWSPCGRFTATVCRDGKIRIYDPRKNSLPLREGTGPAGVRGARILWVLDGKYLIVSGFSKLSERQLSIYKTVDLSKPLHVSTIDVSSAVLIPYYDSDSSTLFLTGKGDCTIYAFEVSTDPPHLFALSHHKCNSLHQIEYFQDDLFPPTKVTWEPSMTSAEWLGGTNRQARIISLRPSQMVALSEAKENNSSNGSAETPTKLTTCHKRQETPTFLKGMIPVELKVTQHKLEESMSKQMNIVNTSLEQDNMEGVDSNEWDD